MTARSIWHNQNKWCHGYQRKPTDQIIAFAGDERTTSAERCSSSSHEYMGKDKCLRLNVYLTSLYSEVFYHYNKKL